MDLKIPLAQDSFSFLKALSTLWQQMIKDDNPRTIKQISISLYGLVPADKIMPDMFKELDDPVSITQKRHTRLSLAMDKINKLYGLDTVVLGTLHETMSRFSGPKSLSPAFPKKPNSMNNS